MYALGGKSDPHQYLADPEKSTTYRDLKVTNL